MTWLSDLINRNNEGADNLGAISNLLALRPNSALEIYPDDENNATPLHLAKSPKAIQILINAGADREIENSDGYTPLHYHIQMGSPLDTIKAFIDNNANLNTRDEFNTPVLYHINNPQIMEMFIKAGADINILDSDDCSALNNLVGTNHILLVEMLIKAGATIDKFPSGIDNYTLNSANTAEMAQMLINAGAETININFQNNPHINFNNNPAVYTLINNHAAKLRQKLTTLAALPDDIKELSKADKNLLTQLTAPKQAGAILQERVELNGKNLINYLRDDKPNLLLFAEGYHKEHIFGDVNPQPTDNQLLSRLFNIVRTIDIKKDPSILTQDTPHPSQLLGITQRNSHDKASTKIQKIARGYMNREDFDAKKAACTDIQAFARGSITRKHLRNLDINPRPRQRMRI